MKKKDKSKSDKLVTYVIFPIILATFFIYQCYIDNLSNEENGKYANAVILKLEKRPAGKSKTPWMKYKFFVDGIEYEGSGRWYPNLDALSVGDTIAVVYSKKYPKINSSKHCLDERPNLFLIFLVLAMIYGIFLLYCNYISTVEIKAIKLNHSDFLELSIGNNHWTHISIVTATSKILLGADVYSVICTKLKAALRPYEATDLVGEINGISVVNILNLSENHYSLYLGKTAENSPILFFQNSDGILVDSLTLDVKVLERELNSL